MGLNLKIKRVIFHTLTRMTASGIRKVIDDSEIKQIAGRAGRYLDEGIVMAMNAADLGVLEKALRTMPKCEVINHLTPRPNSPPVQNPEAKPAPILPIEWSAPEEYKDEDEDDSELASDESGEEEEEVLHVHKPKVNSEAFDPDLGPKVVSITRNGRKYLKEECDIDQAGLFPTSQQVESFAKHLEKLEGGKVTLLKVFKRFVGIAQVEGLFFIQKYDNFCEMAEMMEGLEMSIRDQYIFANAPLHLRWKKAAKYFHEFAKRYSKNQPVPLPRELLLDKVSVERDAGYELVELEVLHHSIYHLC